MPRPKLQDKTMLSVYMNAEMYDRLYKEARKRGMTMAAIAREAIKAELNK